MSKAAPVQDGPRSMSARARALVRVTGRNLAWIGGLLIVIGSVYLLVPGDHVVRFHYAPVPAAADPRPLMTDWIRGQWPRAEPVWPDSQACRQPGAMLLEVKVRGSIPHLFGITHGALDQRARRLGLEPCAGMGVQAQGPARLLWNWIGGWRR